MDNTILFEENYYGSTRYHDYGPKKFLSDVMLLKKEIT